MEALIQNVAYCVFLFAFLAAVLFMTVYTAMARWWRSEIGWARISLDFGLAMALFPSVLHFLLGVRIANSYGFAWFTIGAIAFVGCVSLWNLALVVRSQLKGRLK